MLLDDINDLNADDIRQELFYYMQENPISISEIAKVCGAHNLTLEAFLYSRTKRGPDIKTVLQVKKFLRDRYAQRDAAFKGA